MKKLLSAVLLCYALVLPVRAQDVLELLSRAASSEGEEYTTNRNAIIQKGKDLLPDLARIQNDKSADWKIRLMADISKEHIERAGDITELQEKDWKADPAFDKNWMRYHDGYANHMRPLIMKRLQEKGLWNYYLELIWKKRMELSPEKGKPAYLGSTEVTMLGSPVEETFFRVLEDRLERDPKMEDMYSVGAFHFILDYKIHRLFLLS